MINNLQISPHCHRHNVGVNLEGQMYIICLFIYSCTGSEMNMEEAEQKAQWHQDKVIGQDRCACVSVHLCVSTLCQEGLVRGYQWPSPYPCPLCPSIFFVPPFPLPISHQWAVCPSITSHTYFGSHQQTQMWVVYSWTSLRFCADTSEE